MEGGGKEEEELFGKAQLLLRAPPCTCVLLLSPSRFGEERSQPVRCRSTNVAAFNRIHIRCCSLSAPLLQRPGTIFAHGVSDGPFAVHEPSEGVEVRPEPARQLNRHFCDATYTFCFPYGVHMVLSSTMVRSSRMCDDPVCSRASMSTRGSVCFDVARAGPITSVSDLRRCCKAVVVEDVAANDVQHGSVSSAQAVPA